MRKAKITLTITKEVELNPDWYYTESVEDMLDLAMQQADNMPFEFLGDGDFNLFVEGKLIEEGKQKD